MSNITYIIATLLLLAWAACYFVFKLGEPSHLILAYSLLLFLLRGISGKRIVEA